MSSIINTNVLSLSTQNNLNKSQVSLNSAIERLSSGMRINSASDDTAGQAIANRFTANINGLTQASRNANDGISLVQITEGALGGINSNLQRIRELAVQSLNGTNSATDLASIQAEITHRLAEIEHTASKTDFNGNKVLNSPQTVSVQVGASDGDTIKISLGDMKSAALFVGSTPTGTTTNVTANPRNLNMLAEIDLALKIVDTQRSSLGAVQNGFESVISGLGTTITNLTAARSRIQDADYATEVSNMTRANIMQQAGMSVLAQANQSTQGVMTLLR